MHSVSHHANNHAVFAFDGITVDAYAHTVYRDNTACDLEPKAFAVLLYLLSYPGELVTKDELLDAVWKHRCVTPNVLSRVITQIRRVLGDAAHHPQYIETVPTIGYRFIAQIKYRNAHNGGSTDREFVFKKDLANSSALFEELKLLLSQLDGETHAYPALTRHLSALIALFGDKPSGMMLYELALEYGLEKLKGLDMELPWRHGERRVADMTEAGEIPRHKTS